MKDLQAIIDQRADDKLNDKLSDKIFMLDNITLDEFIPLMEKYKTTNMKNWSMGSILTSNDVRAFVRKKKLDSFRETEAENFVREVEALKSKVADLNDEVSSLNY